MSDNEKRSTYNKMTINKEESIILYSNILMQLGGVGGRQKEITNPKDVGGYLDICSISDFDFTAKIRENDPRINQLIEMGIGKQWIRFATTAGYEAFMALWVIIGRDESIRICMPPFSKFKRYQRNQYIRQLSSNGMRREQIKKKIKKNLCEDISLRHIDRICEKGKII